MARLQLTWLLDDNGIPANWANMEGYGVNTFKLINAQARRTSASSTSCPRRVSTHAALRPICYILTRLTVYGSAVESFTILHLS